MTEVCPESWFGGKYGEGTGDTFFARFFVDPETFLKVSPEITVPPDQVAAWKGDRQGALVSDNLAKKYGWKLGDRIVLEGDIYAPFNAELNLRAIYAGGEDALLFHRKYVTESLWPGGVGAEERSVGTFAIQVDDANNVGPVAKAVDAMFADSDAPTKTETEKEELKEKVMKSLEEIKK